MEAFRMRSSYKNKRQFPPNYSSCIFDLTEGAYLFARLLLNPVLTDQDVGSDPKSKGLRTTGIDKGTKVF